jgi:hypothetical protein
MKSLAIFIQGTILWFVSLLVAAFTGFVGGAIYEEHKNDKKELDENRDKAAMYMHKHMWDGTVSFDSETAKNWSDDLQINALFIRNIQNWANERLKAHGFIFLNEIYGELGVPKTFKGQIVGWHTDNDNSRVLISMSNPTDEGGLTLKFNVDGDILEKLP